MNENELKARTKQFGLRIVKVVDALPNTIAGQEIGRQLLRSGMSVGANYRAACRGRSVAEFAAKLGIVEEEEEEADESAFWLEVVGESGLLRKRRVASLLEEANEITAIMTSSRKTTRRNQANRKSKIKNRKSTKDNGK